MPAGTVIKEGAVSCLWNYAIREYGGRTDVAWESYETPFFLGGVFYGWLSELIKNWDSLYQDYRKPAKVYHPIKKAILLWNETAEIGAVIPIEYGNTYTHSELLFSEPGNINELRRHNRVLDRHRYTHEKDAMLPYKAPDSTLARWQDEGRVISVDGPGAGKVVAAALPSIL